MRGHVNDEEMAVLCRNYVMKVLHQSINCIILVFLLSDCSYMD